MNLNYIIILPTHLCPSDVEPLIVVLLLFLINLPIYI